MIKIVIVVTGLFFWINFSNAQAYDKVYLDDSDSTQFYFKVTPVSQAKGLLILLPGIRGNSEWPLRTTKIPYIAADSGLVTMMINYEIWLGWLREDVLHLLNESIEDVLATYKIHTENCVIGGFSSGGLMALIYTELAYCDRRKTAIVPKGVFGLDPPVDLIELYNVLHFEIQDSVHNGKKVTVSDETKYMHKKMTAYLGNPRENKNNYIKNSPFVFSERYDTGGQAIYLKDVPVRIYSGIGNSYLKRKIDGSLYLDSSAYFISFLKQKGNKNATFKSQYDDDYYPDGGEKFRGKHAWLGFDSKECVEWIMTTINDR